MQIDWVTVLAQIANFLVLIWLLQRFLYGPITRAMARRETRISEELEQARAAGEQAEAEAQKLRNQQEELETARAAALEEARQAAKALRTELEQDLRREMAQKHRVWLGHLAEERAEILRDLEKRLAGHATEAVRRILADFAGADLAGQVAEEFIRRIETLAEDDRDRLARAARRMSGHALVESGVELPTASRAQITRALHETLAERIEVDYRSSDEVLLGVRLTLGDQVVEWSASRYLDRFRTQVDEALDSAVAEVSDLAGAAEAGDG